MNGALLDLAHARLQKLLWKFAIMDATFKYNIFTSHETIKTDPERIWYTAWTLPEFLLSFGAIGRITDPRPK